VFFFFFFFFFLSNGIYSFIQQQIEMKQKVSEAQKALRKLTGG